MRKNNLKKVGILTLAISLFATTSLVFADEIPCKECKNKPMTVATTVDTKSHYKDMNDTHWANKYVNYCASKGMIDGYPDGTFRPNEMVGMEEFVKMVVAYKYGNLPAQKGEKWYMPYVNKGVETGILVDKNLKQDKILEKLRCPCFDSNSKETNLGKLGAMKIINNLLHLDGDTEIINKVNADLARKIAETFQTHSMKARKSSNIMDWNENVRIEAMQVVASGIISGNEKKELILGDFTRAECAAILARYADKDLRKPYIKDVDTLAKLDMFKGYKVLRREIINGKEEAILNKADFLDSFEVEKDIENSKVFNIFSKFNQEWQYQAYVDENGIYHSSSMGWYVNTENMNNVKYMMLSRNGNEHVFIENPAKEVFTKFGLIK